MSAFVECALVLTNILFDLPHSLIILHRQLPALASGRKGERPLGVDCITARFAGMISDS